MIDDGWPPLMVAMVVGVVARCHDNNMLSEFTLAPWREVKLLHTRTIFEYA